MGPSWRSPMPNTKQDRSRVAGSQDYEVEYEADKTGTSKTAVKDAVKSEGNSRKAVEKKLASK
ncbi:DUF3606 domain-containing protein [Devosia sp. FJ2-5-3]|nr:DUF3606 domain-containing protein [Devosia sp. FJ2-5-3]WEJ60444.1 DUF3606 domain-containing protein [Devosia sp. FJ2-5-3]